MFNLLIHDKYLDQLPKNQVQVKNKAMNRVYTVFLQTIDMNIERQQQQKLMNKNDMRTNHQAQKGPSMVSLIHLKLNDSSHNASNKFKFDELYLKLNTCNINTPSTIADFKKFHSCEHNQKKKESATQLLQSIKLDGKHRRCESTTKILTLREIKKEEDKSKQKDKPQKPEVVSKSSSRKLFVSISKRNFESPEKRKQINNGINEIDWDMVAEQKQKRQKIKLNVYKNIARKNMQHNK